MTTTATLRVMPGDLWRGPATDTGHPTYTDWTAAPTPTGDLALHCHNLTIPATEIADRDLVLTRRAGHYALHHCPFTADTFTPSQVASHPDWDGGAPVRLTAVQNRTGGEVEVTYELLGGEPGEVGVGALSREVRLTLWVPVSDPV